MYAIIKSGSTQYKVSEGDEVRMQRIAGAAKGSQVEFNEVLLISKDSADGAQAATVGAPFVQGAKVLGEIVKDDVKSPKMVMVRFRRRKGVRVKRGHRQKYFDVKIKQIVAP